MFPNYEFYFKIWSSNSRRIVKNAKYLASIIPVYLCNSTTKWFLKRLGNTFFKARVGGMTNSLLQKKQFKQNPYMGILDGVSMDWDFLLQWAGSEPEGKQANPNSQLPHHVEGDLGLNLE